MVVFVSIMKWQSKIFRIEMGGGGCSEAISNVTNVHNYTQFYTHITMDQKREREERDRVLRIRRKKENAVRKNKNEK